MTGDMRYEWSDGTQLDRTRWYSENTQGVGGTVTWLVYNHEIGDRSDFESQVWEEVKKRTRKVEKKKKKYILEVEV
jgi:hypothetical protein